MSSLDSSQLGGSAGKTNPQVMSQNCSGYNTMTTDEDYGWQHWLWLTISPMPTLDPVATATLESERPATPAALCS